MSFCCNYRLKNHSPSHWYPKEFQKKLAFRGYSFRTKLASQIASRLMLLGNMQKEGSFIKRALSTTQIYCPHLKTKMPKRVILNWLDTHMSWYKSTRAPQLSFRLSRIVGLRMSRVLLLCSFFGDFYCSPINYSKRFFKIKRPNGPCRLKYSWRSY